MMSRYWLVAAGLWFLAAPALAQVVTGQAQIADGEGHWRKWKPVGGPKWVFVANCPRSAIGS